MHTMGHGLLSPLLTEFMSHVLVSPVLTESMDHCLPSPMIESMAPTLRNSNPNSISKMHESNSAAFIKFTF